MTFDKKMTSGYNGVSGLINVTSGTEMRFWVLIITVQVMI
jgi:hypothetical protein